MYASLGLNELKNKFSYAIDHLNFFWQISAYKVLRCVQLCLYIKCCSRGVKKCLFNICYYSWMGNLTTMSQSYAIKLTAIKQTMFRKNREIGNPLLALLLPGSFSQDENTLWFVKECVALYNLTSLGQCATPFLMYQSRRLNEILQWQTCRQTTAIQTTRLEMTSISMTKMPDI